MNNQMIESTVQHRDHGPLGTCQLDAGIPPQQSRTVREVLTSLGLPAWKVDFTMRYCGEDLPRAIHMVAEDLVRNALAAGEDTAPIFAAFSAAGHPLNERLFPSGLPGGSALKMLQKEYCNAHRD